MRLRHRLSRVLIFLDKFTFLRVLTPKCYCSLVKTPKRTFLVFWALIGRSRTRGAIGTLSEDYKNKKGSSACTAKIGVFAQTPPVSRSLPNLARVLTSRKCFLVLSFRNIRRKCGRAYFSCVAGGTNVSPVLAFVPPVLVICPTIFDRIYGEHIVKLWQIIEKWAIVYPTMQPSFVKL